ncbi:threonylcarbamoyl-AMP synthase [Bermanella marisrubri]|uniref:Threonylcarbamoyl-AMP synthase n=1 Tax=Bermanella marisrubri TaxID=207949 RepID=Q1N3W7_9GAMM|nr:L-threonylcarbamoyladenylate synthase [Bermanella marisrubri]EAT13098.1 Sua5/YciO/YrdC/YwlC family protein [Oceanobacter sp. RED65] [Bermanella marisrubri]QIZ82790.1 threonylcarbamoyl-AMP synthase [Bermanella marisrubri]
MHWPTYQASKVLQHSGVIAYPTETVWGLGCDPWDPAALQRIVSIKKRDQHKGLILVAGNIGQFDFLLNEINEQQRAKLESLWPGPYTFLVPHKNRVQPLVHGRFSTVAIRVSPHPRVQALCKYFGGPIVSTSANYSGQPTVRSAVQARRVLGHELDFILDGPVGLFPGPSHIIDLASGRQLR